MPHNFIRVITVQRLCVNDGPGVRTSVFLKGCFLQCPWCCNPESIHYNKDFYFRNSDCILTSSICNDCTLRQGSRPMKECPMGVFDLTYQDYSNEQLFELILKDEKIYRESNGGVTFSGGEPLYQAEALIPLLRKLKEKGIHIAAETSLYVPFDSLAVIAKYISYWIIDLKLQKGYFPNKNECMASKPNLLANIKFIQTKFPISQVKYRMVVFGGVSTQSEQIINQLKHYNVNEIELLPYHSFARSKYNKLALPFIEYTTPSMTEFELLKNKLLQHAILPSFEVL